MACTRMFGGDLVQTSFSSKPSWGLLSHSVFSFVSPPAPGLALRKRSANAGYTDIGNSQNRGIPNPPCCLACQLHEAIMARLLIEESEKMVNG